MAYQEPSFTLGIEEEYLLVNKESRDLVREPDPGFLKLAGEKIGERVTPEYLQCQVEVGTQPHERVGEAVAEIVEEAATSNIVVVTHATPIKSAVAWLLDGTAEMIMRLRVSLASVTAFGPVGHGMVLTEFNWCPARHIG